MNVPKLNVNSFRKLVMIAFAGQVGIRRSQIPQRDRAYLNFVSIRNYDRALNLFQLSSIRIGFRMYEVLNPILF